MRFVCLFVLFLFSKLSSTGQVPYHYVFNEENGLPSSEIYQILQDKKGYIWIGSDAGLLKYNGQIFSKLQSSKQSGISKSNLQLSPNGKLWCQNFSGQLFIQERDSLRLLSATQLKGLILINYVFDQQSKAWLLFQDRLQVYTEEGEFVREVRFSLKDKTLNFSNLHFDTNGDLYISTRQKLLVHIDRNQLPLAMAQLNSIPLNIEGSYRYSLEKFCGGLYLWQEGLQERSYAISKIDHGKVLPLSQFLPPSASAFIYKIFCSENRMYACTSQGIYKMENFRPLYDQVPYFQLDKISNLFQDREGNLWVSSLQNGIYVMPNEEILLLSSENNQSLQDKNLSLVGVRPTGEILIGTHLGNLYLFDPSNSKLPLKEMPKEEKTSYRAARKYFNYKGMEIVSRGKTSAFIDAKLFDLPLYNLRDLCIYNDTLFGAYSDGISKFYPINEENIKSLKIQLKQVLPYSSRCVALDSAKNTLYMGTSEGLFYERKGKIDTLKYKSKHLYANVLHWEKDSLWVASSNQGILVFKNHKLLFELGAKELGGSEIKALFKDGADLWASTENGLVRYIIPFKTVYQYGQSDGVNVKEINKIVVNKGIVYLATSKGLLYFPVDTRHRNQVAPLINLQSLKVNEKEIGDWQNGLDLAYGNNAISVQFEGISLRSRGKFSYSFRIKNYNDEWAELDSRSNTLRFSALPAGEYLLQIKAYNEDGIQSEQVLEIAIRIAPPFWQKWWFILAIILLVGGAVYWLIIWQLNSLKRKSEVKNRLVSSQLSALRAQMNPHFMYNTLASIQNLVLQNESQKSSYYISKFSLLMRKILEASSSQEIELSEELSLLELYLELEKLRFGDSFEFRFQVADSLEERNPKIPSMLIQPYVENAVKHGLLHKKEKKLLDVHFYEEEGYMVCSVEDNGIGRKKAMEIKMRSKLNHKSFATEASGKRIELFNLSKDRKMRIQVIDKEEQGQSTGTQVLLYFPL